MPRSADDVLEAVDAVQVVQAAVVTDFNVQSLQSAIHWLVEQHEQSTALLAVARAERDELKARLTALELDARSQTAGGGQLKEHVNLLQEQQEQMRANTDSTLASLQPRISAVENQVQIARNERERIEQMGEARLRTLNIHIDERLDGLIQRVEEQERARMDEAAQTNQRIDELATRIMETHEELSTKIDEKCAAVQLRVEMSVDDAYRKIEEIQKSRHSPPPNACAVPSESSASAAIDEGDKRSSLTGRIGHVEWLLDALQNDFEAIYANHNKMKAEHSEQLAAHSEQLIDILGARAQEFNNTKTATAAEGGSAPMLKDEQHQHHNGSGGARRQRVSHESRESRESRESSHASAPAPLSEQRNLFDEDESDGEGSLQDRLEARLDALEREVRRGAEERGALRGGVSTSVVEAIEAQLSPLKRALAGKAEASEIARIDTLVRSAGGREEGADGSGAGSDSSNKAVAAALGKMAEETSRLEALCDTLDGVAAQTEQLALKVNANERFAASEQLALRETVQRLERAMEGDGITLSATNAARRAVSAPLELLALSICQIVEGDRWGQPPSGETSEQRQPAFHFTAALDALRPLRADAAAAGGSALTRVADLVMSKELHAKADERALADLMRQIASGVTPKPAGNSPTKATVTQESPPGVRAQPPQPGPSAPRGGGGLRSMTRPHSTTSLGRPSSVSSLFAAASGPLPHVILSDHTSLEARVRDIERSLSPASGLELRLSTIEKAARAAAASSPKDAFGKVWSAINRMHYRMQLLENYQSNGRLGNYAKGGARQSSGKEPGVRLNSQGTSLSPPLSAMPQPRATGGLSVSLSVGSCDRPRSKQLDALQPLRHEHSSEAITPLPSHASTRPPSASIRAPCNTPIGASLRPLSADGRPRTPPSINRGDPELGTDFHLGVTSEALTGE